jgi:hypothetical protein
MRHVPLWSSLARCRINSSVIEGIVKLFSETFRYAPTTSLNPSEAGHSSGNFARERAHHKSL